MHLNAQLYKAVANNLLGGGEFSPFLSFLFLLPFPWPQSGTLKSSYKPGERCKLPAES